MAVMYETLMEYYRRDVPKPSETRLREYMQECANRGISIIFQLPLSAEPFILSGQIQVVKSDQFSTLLRLPHGAVRFLEWDVPVVLLKSNAKSMDLLIDLPLQEILRKEIFGVSMDVSPMREILLRKRYVRKATDGFLVDEERIIYDPRNEEVWEKDSNRVSLFEPSADLASEKTILNQYKRAFWERKKEIFIIPYFSFLTDQPHWKGLPDFTAHIQSHVNPLRLRTTLGEPSRLLVVLRILLLLSIMSFIFPKWWQILLCSLPYMIFSQEVWMVNFYLMLLSVALPVVFVDFLASVLNDAKKYFLSLLGALFLAGALISGVGSHPSYVSALAAPAGVKVSILFSFLLVLAYLQWNYALMDFSRPVRWKDVSFMLVLLMVLLLFVVRSGNAPGIFNPGPLELFVRDFLDSWLPFRPRFKEFLFTFPVLLLIPFVYRTMPKKSKLPVWMLLLGSLGFISVINSFWHFHSFLLVSYARTFLGLILSIPVAWGLWLGYAFLFSGQKGRQRLSYFKKVWSRFVSGKGKVPRFPM
jgi:hypothetical protein